MYIQWCSSTKTTKRNKKHLYGNSSNVKSCCSKTLSKKTFKTKKDMAAFILDFSQAISFRPIWNELPLVAVHAFIFNTPRQVLFFFFFFFFIESGWEAFLCHFKFLPANIFGNFLFYSPLTMQILNVRNSYF